MEHKAIMIMLVQLLGLSLANADGMDKSCFDDVATCTNSLRNLMVDEDTFWFGRHFLKRCPPGSGAWDTNCNNPSFTTFSILSRMYNTSNANDLQKYLAANNNLKLADVTFPAEKGHYYGCGHTYHEPGKSPYRLDPTKVTTLNTWRLDFTPDITWPTDANDAGSLYTVLVTDLGSFYFHGLYINAQGGSVATATPIKPYHGPMNPRTLPNIYVFAVFRQNGFINPGTAFSALGKTMGTYMGTVPFAGLSAELGGSISDMVAANILAVIGDAYSMQRQKQNNIINSCPLLITQSPAIKSILYKVNVNANWTEEKVTLDYTEPSHLASLNTELEVEYSMDKDMVVKACCVETTFTKTLYRPDPLGTAVTRPAIVSKAPRIVIAPIYVLTNLYDNVNDKTYTLAMVDMTDPTFLVMHWLVTDIHDGDVTKGHHVLPYLGPNPLESNAPRTYVFLLLKQQDDKLNTDNLSQFASDACPYFLENRCGFQLSRLMESWNIKEIVGITWLQAEQDAFARKRWYSEWKYTTMIEVCDGQPGYEDPCPEQQYCPVTRSNEGRTVTATAGLVVALVSVATTVMGHSLL